MTEVKFTKGEWEVKSTSIHPGRVKVKDKKGSQGRIIGDVRSIDDANLIAVAPEMHEMLMKMQAVMFHLSNEQGLIESKREACRDDFSTINGLLAKARGE